MRVIEGNGATVPFDAADVIYVNAGITHPENTWLDGLTDGGRLILPLTTDQCWIRGDGWCLACDPQQPIKQPV